MISRPWTNEELDMLFDMKLKGFTWPEISKSLYASFQYREYTPNACRKRYKKGHECTCAKIPSAKDFLEKESRDTIVASKGSSWSDDEMLLLYQLKKSGRTHKETADIMSKGSPSREYNENIIKQKWAKTDWESYFLDRQGRNERLAELEYEDGEKQRIIDDTLANQEKINRREKARTDVIIENIKSAIYRLPKPRPSQLDYNPPYGEKYTPEHVGVVLSDFHVGANYNLKETGGLGEYNLQIFQKRMKILKDALIEIVERHRNMYQIPHLHVFCLGDIVAGMNDAGNWSPVYIDLSIYDQMINGVAELRNLIATWSRAFPEITFYGVYGNHGRISRRGIQKVSDNWDRVAYSFLEVSLKEYDNITWKIPETWWMLENIQNHLFYLTHGDGIRGSMGIPYYGVERTTGRVAGLLAKKNGVPDYTLIGHFHSTAELSTNFGKVIMNGSTMGGDMYSLRDLSRSDRPEQKVFGIHPKKGITWTYNLHLDEE